MGSIINEKKNFIRHVLLNSPPGKINDLVSDIKTLFGSSATIQNSIEDAISNYNEKNFVLIPLEDNEYVIICEQSKINNSYVHPKLKILATVNHLKRKVTGTTELKELNYPQELESYRELCSVKLEKYLQAHYSKWNEKQTINYPSVNLKCKNGLSSKCSSSVYASKRGDRFNLFFIICRDRYYLKNFHASSWRSSWEVNFLLTDDQVLLRGNIDVALTYFEDANINFKTTKKFEKTVLVNKDVEQFSSTILSAISEFENSTLYDLNNFFININKELIKSTRKIIPLNGDKFNWMETYQDIPMQIKLT
ncbi:F-actin-capping protein subunit alpha [Plasmodium brasilianum]|uniref:F-actin-capping protein subunit alpha n=2 Tax=Plasmodium (Plasmodium) TaxID=418103 RepID=A0A1D3RHH1_PLAMA|nr:F-actin-capping protein subunit alpha, putative [Plasmodium malariae]KAI4837698.1 F-actin-capping protein subunit alpha [Plasmodium brasilianum]SCN44621.1 F-actin-capping protein subunit alpha, putative [Plasmodium malariae]